MIRDILPLIFFIPISVGGFYIQGKAYQAVEGLRAFRDQYDLLAIEEEVDSVLIFGAIGGTIFFIGLFGIMGCLVLIVT